MKSMVRLPMAAVLTVMTIALVMIGSRADASSDSDKAEIIALNQRITDAASNRDLDAFMANYLDANDAIFYEDTIPFQVEGKAGLRMFNQEFFQSSSQIHAGMGPITVAVCGDLAVAYYTLTITSTDKDGDHSEKGRYTQVLKKVDGKWLIWHEHFSVPYDPETEKAVLDANP